MFTPNEIHSTMTLREATPADAAALRALFAPYVERTAITFELAVPTVAEMERRVLAVRELGYPWLVAEGRDGGLLGYAYAARFKRQAAYAHCVETSIYVARTARRSGVGRRLYAELERRLLAAGVLNMNACITHQPAPDDHLPAGSEAFHRAMGFVRCAHFHRCGRKFGRWYDMIWMEKLIGPHRSSPENDSSTPFNKA